MTISVLSRGRAGNTRAAGPRANRHASARLTSESYDWITYRNWGGDQTRPTLQGFAVQVNHDDPAMPYHVRPDNDVNPSAPPLFRHSQPRYIRDWVEREAARNRNR